MKQVLLATFPGVLVLTWFFGPGTIVNIVFGSALALAFEAWLWLRAKDYKTPLRDHSVIVTAALLCIGTPHAPWWLTRRYWCLGSPRQTRIRGLGVQPVQPRHGGLRRVTRLISHR